MRITKTQQAYYEGHAAGYRRGVEEGRAAGRKEATEDQKARRDLEVWRLRMQAIDAIAHAVRAMADELHQ